MVLLYSYSSYAGFLKDLSLVFRNARVYNKVHKDSDTTGVSLSVYEKAIRTEELV